MSKAEALKAYCDNCRYRGNCAYLNRGMESKCLELDTYSSGYEQAEEDLALTWEDIPKILHICENLKTSWWFMDNEQTKQIGTQPFWEEILRRFNEEKGNKA